MLEARRELGFDNLDEQLEVVFDGAVAEGKLNGLSPAAIKANAEQALADYAAWAFNSIEALYKVKSDAFDAKEDEKRRKRGKDPCGLDKLSGELDSSVISKYYERSSSGDS